ncbi:MAG: acyl-CoA desaturase [Pseudomonadota bacterium]
MTVVSTTSEISTKFDAIEQSFARSESTFRSPRMFDDHACSVAGRVVWNPQKSLWLIFMASVAVVLGPLFFTWGAFVLFILTTGFTVCFGHSLGMHRLLIHRAYCCPLWLERLMVYLGTLVGMAGPFGMIRQHDIRDWAQRKRACHPFLSHNSSFLLDGFWQLNCELKLAKPPRLSFERRVKTDRFYRFIDRTWMAQQIPWAILFWTIGGLPWVVWGVAARVTVSVIGHWLIGYFAHNRGARSWHVTDSGVQGYNVPLCGVLTMGESWHNNHHAFPASARLGQKRGEADPGWWALKGLKSLGLVWNLKTPDDLPERASLVPIEG